MRCCIGTIRGFELSGDEWAPANFISVDLSPGVAFVPNFSRIFLSVRLLWTKQVSPVRTAEPPAFCGRCRHVPSQTFCIWVERARGQCRKRVRRGSHTNVSSALPRERLTVLDDLGMERKPAFVRGR